MKKVFLILLILIVTIGFCYLPLHVFVLKPKIPFLTAGPIGDMFAGLTMPIISIISIILLFLSFYEQLEANKIQNKALQEEIRRSTTVKELDQVLDLLKDVKEEFENLKLMVDLTDFSGHDTIHNIQDVVDDSNDYAYRVYLKNLVKPLDLLEFVCSKTKSYNFELRDERVIYEKIRLIYPKDFQDGLESFIRRGNPFPEDFKVRVYRRQIFDYHMHICEYLINFKHKLEDEYINLQVDHEFAKLHAKATRLAVKKEYLNKLSTLKEFI